MFFLPEENRVLVFQTRKKEYYSALCFLFVVVVVWLLFAGTVNKAKQKKKQNVVQFLHHLQRRSTLQHYPVSIKAIVSFNKTDLVSFTCIFLLLKFFVKVDFEVFCQS